MFSQRVQRKLSVVTGYLPHVLRFWARCNKNETRVQVTQNSHTAIWQHPLSSSSPFVDVSTPVSHAGPVTLDSSTKGQRRNGKPNHESMFLKSVFKILHSAAWSLYKTCRKISKFRDFEIAQIRDPPGGNSRTSTSSDQWKEIRLLRGWNVTFSSTLSSRDRPFEPERSGDFYHLSACPFTDCTNKNSFSYHIVSGPSSDC